jgi:hypothetical protein
MKDPSIPISHCRQESPEGNGNLTCSGTWLVPCQVSHFFGLKPYKNAVFKEVVQKLKFMNNPIQLPYW